MMQEVRSHTIRPDRTAIVNDGLLRLAEARGDIVDPVMERFYARFPDALASFEHHGLGNRHSLEGTMVEQSIYFLMTWPEDPAQLRIIISESVIHHHDTLEVVPQWYIGMMDAVIELVFEVLPPNDGGARGEWLAIRNELASEIDKARRDCFRAGADGPLPEFEAPTNSRNG